MTEQEMLEAEKHWCENCCNFDKEGMCHDGYSTCKVTNMLTYSECCGKECKFFDVPAENVIVPPCKVGDTVWCIVEGFDRVMEGRVRRFTVGESYINVYCGIDGYFEQVYNAKQFGDKIFHSKEDAEKALKEREG